MAQTPPQATIPRAGSSSVRTREEPLAERVVALFERRWRWALGVLLAADLLLLLYMGRGLSFYYDEWDWVVHDYGGGLHSLLEPHVGNISVFPVAVYKVLFHLVGLNHYAVYRLVLIGLHLTAGTLVFVLASRRLPRLGALLAAALILFLGAAWEDLLWAFQIGYMLSIVGGLAAWTLLDGHGRRSDLGALVCLIVAAGSSSLGIAIIVGVAVELAWKREWRRMWIVLVPAALYVLWYLGYGVSEVTSASLINAPGFAADLGAAAFGGLVGRALEWGRPLAVVGVLVLLARLLRPAAVSARLVGLIAAALTLWTITAAARSTISVPETGRYMYLGSVIIVLVAVELLHERSVLPRGLVIATPLVAFFAITGLTALHAGAGGLRTTSHRVTADLGALELAAAYAPPEFQPDPILAPDVRAGVYLHAVRSIGSSPADSVSAMLAAEPTPRAAADGVLVALEAPTVAALAGPQRSAPGAAPRVLLASSATAAQQGACVAFVPAAGTTGQAIVAMPPGGVIVRDRGAGTTSFAIKRFGDPFVPLAGTAAPHRAVMVTVRSDSAPAVPWQLQVTSSSPLSVCGVA